MKNPDAGDADAFTIRPSQTSPQRGRRSQLWSLLFSFEFLAAVLNYLCLLSVERRSWLLFVCACRSCTLIRNSRFSPLRISSPARSSPSPNFRTHLRLVSKQLQRVKMDEETPQTSTSKLPEVRLALSCLFGKFSSLISICSSW